MCSHVSSSWPQMIFWCFLHRPKIQELFSLTWTNVSKASKEFALTKMKEFTLWFPLNRKKLHWCAKSMSMKETKKVMSKSGCLRSKTSWSRHSGAKLRKRMPIIKRFKWINGLINGLVKLFLLLIRSTGRGVLKMPLVITILSPSNSIWLMTSTRSSRWSEEPSLLCLELLWKLWSSFRCMADQWLMNWFNKRSRTWLISNGLHSWGTIGKTKTC